MIVIIIENRLAFQEALIGLTCSVGILVWLAVGSVLYGVKHSTLPTRDDGCQTSIFNITTDPFTHNADNIRSVGDTSLLTSQSPTLFNSENE